jgi:hypothetical protein
MTILDGSPVPQDLLLVLLLRGGKELESRVYSVQSQASARKNNQRSGDKQGTCGGRLGDSCLCSQEVHRHPFLKQKQYLNPRVK